MVMMLAAAFVPDNGVREVSVQSEGDSLSAIRIHVYLIPRRIHGEFALNSKRLHFRRHFLPSDEGSAAAGMQTPGWVMAIKPDTVLPHVPVQD